MVSRDGIAGAMFSVWAPNARLVSVIGSFNSWGARSNVLAPRGDSGIWEGFVPGATKGALYKFHIESRSHGYQVDKADPLGLLHEKPPRTASVISARLAPATYSVVGLANRILAPFARRGYVAWEETARRVGTRKARVFGVPLRSGFGPRPYEPRGTARVLVLGGSQGASALNERVPEALGRAAKAVRCHCPLIDDSTLQNIRPNAARQFARKRE